MTAAMSSCGQRSWMLARLSRRPPARARGAARGGCRRSARGHDAGLPVVSADVDAPGRVNLSFHRAGSRPRSTGGEARQLRRQPMNGDSRDTDASEVRRKARIRVSPRGRRSSTNTAWTAPREAAKPIGAGSEDRLRPERDRGSTAGQRDRTADEREERVSPATRRLTRPSRERVIRLARPRRKTTRRRARSRRPSGSRPGRSTG